MEQEFVTVKGKKCHVTNGDTHKPLNNSPILIAIRNRMNELVRKSLGGIS